MNKSYKSIQINNQIEILYWYRRGIKKSMELIWEKIWKRLVKKNRWKKLAKNFVIPWVGKILSEKTEKSYTM